MKMQSEQGSPDRRLQPPFVLRPKVGGICPVAYCEPLAGVHFDHPPQEVLTVWGDEVRHVEDAQLHLLQEVPQVVVVEGEGALGQAGGRGDAIRTQGRHKPTH